MEKRKYYFTPTHGSTYTNKNGRRYTCIAVEGCYKAKFKEANKYKWTFSAWGCLQYADGKIEWEGSTGGYYLTK